MKNLIAGNWKMNGDRAMIESFTHDLKSELAKTPDLTGERDLLLCVPHLYVSELASQLSSLSVTYGGQDCSAHEKGAYTGEVSASMLRDIGCSYVIVGHSERRAYHGESNTHIAEKAEAAHTQNLTTIICVGETEQQREMAQEEHVVGEQLMQAIPTTATAENTIIAYEPVWAIGTGKTATPEDVSKMHDFIREKLQEHVAQAEKIRILYGGSVKPENASDLLAIDNVNGALIGGASLKAEQFIAIARS